MYCKFCGEKYKTDTCPKCEEKISRRVAEIISKRLKPVGKVG